MAIRRANERWENRSHNRKRKKGSSDAPCGRDAFKYYTTSLSWRSPSGTGSPICDASVPIPRICGRGGIHLSRVAVVPPRLAWHAPLPYLWQSSGPRDIAGPRPQGWDDPGAPMPDSARLAHLDKRSRPTAAGGDPLSTPINNLSRAAHAVSLGGEGRRRVATRSGGDPKRGGHGEWMLGDWAGRQAQPRQPDLVRSE